MACVPCRFMACLGQQPGQPIEIGDGNGRMGLAGRAEVLLDAEMDPHGAALQPEAAAPGKRRGLRHLLHAEQAGIERPAQVFRALRNGELNVIQAQHHASLR